MLPIKKAVSTPAVIDRLSEVLGSKAPQFAASIVQLVGGNYALSKCEPNSVIGACLTAATHNLSIHPSLGQAHIVPFKGKATFILGYKGMIQLSQRTGQYAGMGAIPIYEGQLNSFDPLFGDYELDESVDKTGEPVGYIAAFRLVNGFKKAEYMTRQEVERHALKFSKSFTKDSSPWKTDFEAMAIKTVLRRLMSKWGYMTIDVEGAIADDTTVRDGVSVEVSRPGEIPVDDGDLMRDGEDSGVASLGPVKETVKKEGGEL